MIYLLEFTDTRDGSTFTDAIIGKDDDECKRNHNVVELEREGRIFDNTFDYTFN